LRENGDFRRHDRCSALPHISSRFVDRCWHRRSQMRAIQVKMNSYWADLLNSRNPDIAKYGNLRNTVQEGGFAPMPPIPRGYFSTPPVATPARGTLGGGGDTMGPQQREMGTQVHNTTPTNRGWMTMFGRSHKTVTQLVNDAISGCSQLPTVHQVPPGRNSRWMILESSD
jgi:hypothetical protein